jgi:hypothetical protein
MNGIEIQPGQSPATKVKGGPDSTAVILLNENTKANTSFLQDMKAVNERHVASTFGSANIWVRAYGELLKPTYSVRWLANSMKSQFGKVVLVRGVDEAKNMKFDALIILDVLWDPSSVSNKRVSKARISSAIYDAGLRYVGTATSGEKVSPPGPMGFWSTAEAMQMYRDSHAILVSALTDYDKSLSSFVEVASVKADGWRGGEADSARINQDACIRSALKVGDANLRRQAISACN